MSAVTEFRLKTVGGDSFIETGKGLNLGTQNVSGDGLFLGKNLQW